MSSDIKRLKRNLEKLRKDDGSSDAPPPLQINLKIGKDKSSEFFDVAFTVDTGFISSAAIAITDDLAQKLGIVATGLQSSTGFDSSSMQLQTGTCAVICQELKLAELPLVIGSPAPIVGLRFLQALEVYIKNGKLELIRPSSSSPFVESES